MADSRKNYNEYKSKLTTAKGQLTKSLNKFEALAKDLAKNDLPATSKVRMVAFSILSEKKEGIRKAREKWKTSIIEYDEDSIAANDEEVKIAE